MSYLFFFLAGLFGCNCLPHLAAGLRGERFPTPFSRPRGVGLAGPTANAVWGVTNLTIALSLGRRALGLPFSLEPLALMAGVLVAGLYLSRHFVRVRRAWER